MIALLHAEEDVLELVHTGVGEQQRRVVGGNEARGADDAGAAGSNKVEEGLAYLVTGHHTVGAGQSPWN
jgi:hypothetical protein